MDSVKAAVKLPPNSIGTLTDIDITCLSDGNCVVYFTNPSNKQRQVQNPCGPGEVYDFDSHMCVKKNDYCCKYSNPQLALNDPRCRGLVKEMRTMRNEKHSTCAYDKKEMCCKIENAANPKCGNFWSAPQTVWSEPPNCSAVDAFTNFKSVDEAEDTGLASLDSQFEVFPVQSLQKKRQQMIDFKSIF
jgi:hypothetical protein